MGRFDFQSPGAAFSDQMAKVLSERKADERQRLLDSLAINADTRAQETMKREADQLEIQKAQQAESQKATEASIASQKQQDTFARLREATSNMDEGTDVSGLDPELQSEGGKYGMWRTTPEPSATAAITGMTDAGGAPTTDFSTQAPSLNVTAGMPKAKLTYVGTPQQRAETQQRKEAGIVISALLADPKTAETGKLFASVAGANGGKIPENMWDRLMPIHLKGFSNETGRLSDLGDQPAGTQVITQTRPPREYRPRNEIKIDPDPETGNMRVYNQDTKEVSVIPNSAKLANDGVPLGIPTAMYNKHLDLGNMLDPADLKPTDLRVYRQSAYNMISASKASADVKHLAKLYVNDPAGYRAAGRKTPLTAKEVSELEQLTSIVAGPEILQVLEEHPVKAAQQAAAPIAGVITQNPAAPSILDTKVSKNRTLGDILPSVNPFGPRK